MRTFWLSFSITLAGIFACRTTNSRSHNSARELRPYFVLSAITPEQRNRLEVDFVATNPGKWSSHGFAFDAHTSLLLRAQRPRSSEPSMDARACAASFVDLNHARLGLAREDISKLDFQVDDIEVQRVRIKNNDAIPDRHFESVPSIGKSIQIELNCDSDGVFSLINRSKILPDLSSLARQAGLKADDPRIAAAIIGREMKYFDFAGVERSAGTIASESIQSIELTVASQKIPEGQLWVGLVYMIKIKLGDLGWSFFVNSETAAIEWIEQDFQT